MKAQREQKGKQSSEARRKALLARVDEARTEAKKIEAPVQQRETLEKLKQDVTSAHLDIRKYRDFLKGEQHRLEDVQKELAFLKEARQKKSFEQWKASVLLIVFVLVPFIFIAKLRYLSFIPKNIPTSSSFLYLDVGDALFYVWFILALFYAAAYRYARLHYIDPFLERSHSRFFRFSATLAMASLFSLLYQQFLFYSAATVPTLISPSWGPSLVNIFNLIVSTLTSSYINAIIAVITVAPIGVGLFKKWRKRKSFAFSGDLLRVFRRKVN